MTDPDRLVASPLSGETPGPDLEAIQARWEAAQTGAGHYSVGDAWKAAVDHATEDVEALITEVKRLRAALRGEPSPEQAAEILWAAAGREMQVKYPGVKPWGAFGSQPASIQLGWIEHATEVLKGAALLRGAAPTASAAAGEPSPDPVREAAQRVMALEPALRLKVITTATRDWQEAVAALRAALGEPHPQPERRTE